MGNEEPGSWQKVWKGVQQFVLKPQAGNEVLQQALESARQRAPVPVLWLLGKTQAGKTSIVHTLTGSDRAEIGNGFQPCTRSAYLYDYPEGMPVVRFLDTRGLGEQAYDPAEDIHFCEQQAHLVLAVMKAADPNQDAVIEVLAAVRKRHPDWPVLVAQTGIHELYPANFEHVLPYPFDQGLDDPRVPHDLTRVLSAQRERLSGLPGHGLLRWVVIDLTLQEDGYSPHDFGAEALWREIEFLTDVALRQQLGGESGVEEARARVAHQQIVGHALAAAALGAVPVVDLVAVSALQARLLQVLAQLHGQRWDARLVSEFVGLLGSGVATGVVGRMLGKSIAKLVPGWGQTIGAVWGASTSGAVTYALGKAASYYFVRRGRGEVVDPEALRAIYRDALAAGRALIRNRRDDAG